MTDEEHKAHYPWMKWIPLVSLVIACIALTFQVTVLYPWHLELSRDFASLARFVKKSS